MSEQQNTTYNEEFDEIPIEKLKLEAPYRLISVQYPIV